MNIIIDISFLFFLGFLFPKLSSCFKNKTHQKIIILISSFFLTLQFLSLFLTKSFIGHKFYLQINARGLTNNYLNDTSLILISIFCFLLIIFFSFKTKKRSLLKTPKKTFVIFTGLILGCLKTSFISDFISINKVVFAPQLNNSLTSRYDEYCQDTLRFIAHAGGEINGDLYTNSKEALDYNYALGFRIFELDILETNDNHFVAAHDWNTWSKLTKNNTRTPVSYSTFISKKIKGKYTPLGIHEINKWFLNHPNAILITDKVNKPEAFSKLFIDKRRLIMELFDQKALEEGLKCNILSAMPTQKIVKTYTQYDAGHLAKKGIKHIAISRKFIEENISLLKELKKHGIKAYAYNINFEKGIDEEYVTKYEMDYIYGIYADKWSF